MKLVNVHIQLILFIIFTINEVKVSAQTWSIQQCIDTSLVHNKNLMMSRNTISIGEQKQKEAKANLIPKLAVNLDYKYFTDLPYQLMPLSTFNPNAPEGQFKEAQFGVPHNINANLQLTVPLYNAQLYGAIKSTTIATEMNEMQYRKTEEQLQFEIYNLYYNAQVLHHQLVFIDSNIINANKLLKNITLLNEHLLAKGTDVGKVNLQVKLLQTQKENITIKYIQVLNALKFAIGISIDQEFKIDPKIVNVNSNSENKPDSFSQILDIQILKTQHRLLKSEISTLNKSRVLPSLNLIGSFGTTGFGYDRKPNDFLKFYPIGFAGIQISYPLFNGTVTLRKTNQKKLELKNNELQAELLSDQNKLQIENSKLQIKISKNTLETISEQITLAQSILAQSIEQQKQGTATLNDVLLADNALREIQQNFISTTIEYLKAELELKKMLGLLEIKN
jgi:outer membrane protein TolC